MSLEGDGSTSSIWRPFPRLPSNRERAGGDGGGCGRSVPCKRYWEEFTDDNGLDARHPQAKGSLPGTRRPVTLRAPGVMGTLLDGRGELRDHAPLLLRGQLAVHHGAEPGRLDATQVDALLHQEAAHRLYAPLAQRQVIVQRARRIRVALQLDRQPRILFHVPGQSDQGGLGGIDEIGPPETKAHLDGVDEGALVAAIPEASETAVDLVRAGQSAIRA